MKMQSKLAALALACVTSLLFTACEDIVEIPQESMYAEETETAETMLSPEKLAEKFDDFTVPPVAQDAEMEEETEPSDTSEPTGEMLHTDSVLDGSMFLGRSEEGEERYFFFYDNANGAYLEQETGMGMGFVFELTDTQNAVFHIGDAESSETAELFWLDEDTVMILWESGMNETLTRMENDPQQPFEFYSNEELRERAMQYYEDKTGYRPADAGSMIDGNGDIIIQLYDNMDDHNSTSDWYTINRYTAIGTDILGEEVDLSQVVLTDRISVPRAY